MKYSKLLLPPHYLNISEEDYNRIFRNNTEKKGGNPDDKVLRCSTQYIQRSKGSRR